jgi:KaiC/GvpD/RAD55 family RecA-like ATPase
MENIKQKLNEKINGENEPALIQKESIVVEKAIISTPDLASRFRTANQRLVDAEELPDIQPLVGDYFKEGEVSILFGDTDLGKTIAAYTIANGISKGDKTILGLPSAGVPRRVLYYDYELSDKQFQERYNGHSFSDDLLICVNVLHDEKGSIDIDAFERDIQELQPEVIIIDNITYLSSGSNTEIDVARSIMANLKDVRIKYGVSILVIAHTPKIKPGSYLHINQLGGSKYLSNFSDTIFAIAKSKQGEGIRYIKQLKFRSTPSSNTIQVYEIRHEDNFLGFIHIDEDFESKHAGKIQQEDTGMMEKRKEAMRLRTEEGFSITEVSEKLGLSRSTVGNWLKGVDGSVSSDT